MSVYDEAVRYFGVDGVEEIRAQARAELAAHPYTADDIARLAPLVNLLHDAAERARCHTATAA